MRHKYFLRLWAEDKPGVLSSIASVFGSNGVSIAQMIQRNKRGDLAELVFITDRVQGRHFQDSLTILEGLSVIKEIASVLRVHSA